MRVRKGLYNFKVALDGVNLQRVDYIQSTGTQYIDTEYIPKTTNCIVELDMAWTGTTASDFESFVGFMATGTTPRNGIHKYTSYYMFGANNTIVSTTAPVSNQRIIIKADFTSGNQKLIINGTQVASATTAYSFGNNVLSMYIFNRNYNGPNNYSKMKLYRCKIYESTTLVRDFYPVKNSVTNVAGLYDNITQKFYTNKGTGSFLYGYENGYIPNEYQRLEYIESTGNGSSGNQRIKLDIQPTSKYKIESTFAMTKINITSCLWCARGNSTYANSTTAFYIANSGLRCNYGTNAAMTNIGSLALNTIHTLTMDSNKWYLDGTLKTSMTAANYTAGSKIQLFASHYNGQDSNLGNYGAYKLYSFRVWNENDILVGEFLPCYRISDNVRGLYDTIGKKFYTNAMSGVFVKGENEITSKIVSISKCKPTYRIVPNAYQQLDYISGDGSQYIDTELPANMGYEYEIVFEQNTANTYRIWGAFNQQSYVGPNISLTYVSGSFGLRWESRAGNQTNLTLATIDKKKHTILIKNGECYFDNVYKGKTAGHNASFEINHNAYLFTINPGGYIPSSTMNGKIYKYVVKNENGEIIQKLVPCYRKVDNVVGMYDIINKKFHINIGTGVFVKGNKIC